MRRLKFLYYKLSRLLPSGATKWLKKKIRHSLVKYRNKKFKQKKALAINKFGKFKCDELFLHLRELGIQEGGILFVQTSFNDLYTLDAAPIELLSTLQGLVGETGTLLMPAYTAPKSRQAWKFDIAKEPTYTGIINEIFRRSDGVIRSFHPRHSICGVGQHAQSILADHEKCKRADGIGSPFDKMRKYDDAKILTLGLELGYISFLHWIEDFEPELLPFEVHERNPVKVNLNNKSPSYILDYKVKPSVAAKLCLKNVSNNISKESYVLSEYKGLSINLYDMKRLSEELIRLRNNGIIHYS